MKNSLSIRAYTKQPESHFHPYHQLVLPIQGTINIELDGYNGKVSVGECAVIKAGKQHHFSANEAARFIVVDLQTLPSSLLKSEQVVFTTTPPLRNYLHFVESQLEYQVDQSIEEGIFQLFYILLCKHPLTQQVQQRIRVVQAFINDNIADNLSISTLAQIAYLSPTQFKKLFKDNLGISAHKYITEKRMQKAKALLTHTDLPIQIIAKQVGYNDLSAFSRRFSLYFGLSPRRFLR